MSLENDVAKAMRIMREVGKNVVKERQKILTEASKPMVQMAKSGAPKSGAPHKRYVSAKGRARAGKGQGKVLATYASGNLSRSVQTLKFPRKKSAVFVGVKLQKRGASSGDFRGRRTDGYYLEWVENGTRHSAASRFWLTAYNSSWATMEYKIDRAFAKIIEDYDNKG